MELFKGILGAFEELGVVGSSLLLLGLSLLVALTALRVALAVLKKTK